MKKLSLLKSAKLIIFMICAGSAVFNMMAASAIAGDEPQYQAISPYQVQQTLETMSNYTLVDARTLIEYKNGHLTGAISLPYDEIEALASRELPDKDAAILVYCSNDDSSAIAAATLSKMGYTTIYDIGKFSEWSFEPVLEK